MSRTCHCERATMLAVRSRGVHQLLCYPRNAGQPLKMRAISFESAPTLDTFQFPAGLRIYMSTFNVKDELRCSEELFQHSARKCRSAACAPSHPSLALSLQSMGVFTMGRETTGTVSLCRKSSETEIMNLKAWDRWSFLKHQFPLFPGHLRETACCI